jgi:hypothetical protein
MESLEGFAWAPPGMGDSPPFKIWRDSTRVLGEQCLFEIRYLLSHLRFKKDPWVWFRHNENDGRFAKLLDEGGLSQDLIVRSRQSQKRTRSQAFGASPWSQESQLGTKVVLVWLVDIVMGRAGSAEGKANAIALLNHICVGEGRGMSEYRVPVMSANGWAHAILRVADDGCVVPDIHEQEAFVTEISRVKGPWPPASQGSLPLVLGCCLSLQRHGVPSLMGAWFKSLINQIAKKFERSVGPSGPRLPKALLGSSGKKSRRVDPLARARVVLQKNETAREIARHSIENAAVAFGAQATDRWCKDACAHYISKTKALGSMPPARVGLCHDAASYAGEDTLVIVALLPEQQKCMVLPFQKSRRISAVDDIPMDDTTAELRALGKLQRVATYHNLVSIQSGLRRGLGLGFEDFAIPKGCVVRPPLAGEVWFVDPDTALLSIFNEDTGELEVAMPPSCHPLPILVSYQDQCSVGWAAFHYLCGGEGLVAAFFADSFHRDYNSVKLAAQRCRSYMWGTIVQLTVVFNLNRAPWSSQAFWRVKQESLDHLLRNTRTSDLFQDHIEDISAGFGMKVPETDEELESLRDRLANLRSITNIGPSVKMARWFSWWHAAAYHRPLWHAEVLLLQHYKTAILGQAVEEDEDNVMEEERPLANARAELSRLKQMGDNSLVIASKLMTPLNYVRMCILIEVTQPTLREHAERAHGKSSAEQNLKHCSRMCFEWASVLEETVAVSMRRFESMKRMGVVLDPADLLQHAPSCCSQAVLCDEILDFCFHLVGQRARDLAVGAFLPPDSFASLLSDDEGQKDEALRRHREMWAALQAAEYKARSSKAWESILDKCYWHSWPGIRLGFMLLWEDDFTLGPKSLSFFRAMFLQLGDSRVIEQLHKHVRHHQDHASSNKISTRCQRFLKGVRCGVLEERTGGSSCTPVQLTSTDFAHEVREPKSSGAATFASNLQLLPQSFQRCMQPNKWRSASPAAAFDSLVALQWLMHHKKENLVAKGVNIDDHKLNSFLLPHSIIMDDDHVYFVITTARCGALVWSLDRVEVRDAAM